MLTGNVMRYFIAPTLLSMSLMLAACGQKQQDPIPVTPKPQVGRAETQGIRNTDAIGYSGSAIANKVDSALNANDAQKDRMDQALQSSEGNSPDPK